MVRNAPEPENERQRISTCSTPGGRPCRGHDKEIDTDLKWGIVSIPRNTTAGFREKIFLLRLRELSQDMKEAAA